MQNRIQTLLMSGVLLSLSMTVYCNGQIPNTEQPFYRFALVRDISSSFEDSLKLSPPPIPIDLNLAHQQHENYINIVNKLVQEVIRLDADPNHPDCNFIEDTSIIVGDTAIISRMGAPERQGEEVAVAEALENIGIKNIIHLEFPCSMDGGDILYTGRHLFVGLSRRTNEFALKRLQEIFKDNVEVIGVPVIDGLHLKSQVSFFDSETLVVADTLAGREVQNIISESTKNHYTFITVPDPIASNVLRIGSTLIIQDGFPASEEILQKVCDQKQIEMVKINMSELIKADGALTCGSLLFN